MVDAKLTWAFATASNTGANYCPDVYYLIMLIVRRLLTQRSSCIGRLLVEKRVAKSICSSIRCYIFGSSVHDEMIFQSSNLLSYSLDSTSCIGISQPKNMHISLNMKPSWLSWIGIRQRCMYLVIILTYDAIKHTCVWPLAWHDKYNPYNSSTPLQQFLTFLFTNQRERQARKDERTHHSTMDKS